MQHYKESRQRLNCCVRRSSGRHRPWRFSPVPSGKGDVELAWDKCTEYYRKLDDTPIYLAGVILHPSHKWQRLEALWGGSKKTKKWIQDGKAKILGVRIQIRGRTRQYPEEAVYPVGIRDVPRGPNAKSR